MKEKYSKKEMNISMYLHIWYELRWIIKMIHETTDRVHRRTLGWKKSCVTIGLERESAITMDEKESERGMSTHTHACSIYHFFFAYSVLDYLWLNQILWCTLRHPVCTRASILFSCAFFPARNWIPIPSTFSNQIIIFL